MSHASLPEELWLEIEPLLPPDEAPGPQGGRPRALNKIVMQGIYFVLCTGIRWEDLPKDPRYAHRATAHRWLMFWQKAGVFDRVLTGLLKKAATEGKIDWNRLIGDGSFSPCSWRGSSGNSRI